jgi:hypothetical protein
MANENKSADEGPLLPAKSTSVQRSAFLGYCCDHPYRDWHWFFYDAVHPMKAAANMSL